MNHSGYFVMSQRALILISIFSESLSDLNELVSPTVKLHRRDGLKKTPTGSAGEQINKTSGCFFPAAAAAPLLRNGAVCIIWHLCAHASL